MDPTALPSTHKAFSHGWGMATLIKKFRASSSDVYVSQTSWSVTASSVAHSKKLERSSIVNALRVTWDSLMLIASNLPHLCNLAPNRFLACSVQSCILSIHRTIWNAHRTLSLQVTLCGCQEESPSKTIRHHYLPPKSHSTIYFHVVKFQNTIHLNIPIQAPTAFTGYAIFIIPLLGRDFIQNPFTRQAKSVLLIYSQHVPPLQDSGQSVTKETPSLSARSFLRCHLLQPCNLIAHLLPAHFLTIKIPNM